MANTRHGESCPKCRSWSTPRRAPPPVGFRDKQIEDRAEAARAVPEDDRSAISAARRGARRSQGSWAAEPACPPAAAAAVPAPAMPAAAAVAAAAAAAAIDEHGRVGWGPA